MRYQQPAASTSLGQWIARDDGLWQFFSCISDQRLPTATQITPVFSLRYGSDLLRNFRPKFTIILLPKSSKVWVCRDGNGNNLYRTTTHRCWDLTYSLLQRQDTAYQKAMNLILLISWNEEIL